MLQYLVIPATHDMLTFVQKISLQAFHYVTTVLTILKAAGLPVLALYETNFIIILMSAAEYIFGVIDRLAGFSFEAHNSAVMFDLLEEDMSLFRLQKLPC